LRYAPVSRIRSLDPNAREADSTNPAPNGGGFFNANSAHPYENPTALTNLMQMLLLIGIAAGLTNVLGRALQAGGNMEGKEVLALPQP